MAPTPRDYVSSLTESLQSKFSIRGLKERVATINLTPRGLSNNVLYPRQDSGTPQSDPTIGPIIPTQYDQRNGLEPGAVAGIVLGAVLGTLLLIGLLVWGMSANSGIEEPEETHIEIRDRPVSPSRRRRRSRRDGGYDVEEIRVVRDSSPRRSHRSPRQSGTRTQIVEERIVEERVPVRSRGPSPAPPPPPMQEVYIDRRPARRSGDEEVIVIEGSDFSSIPPPRRKGRRKSGSGYR